MCWPLPPPSPFHFDTQNRLQCLKFFSRHTRKAELEDGGGRARVQLLDGVRRWRRWVGRGENLSKGALPFVNTVVGSSYS